jgi:hypothetical protein
LPGGRIEVRCKEEAGEEQGWAEHEEGREKREEGGN